MEIGFIGLGSMGGPMSRRLVEAGHKLTVFDTRQEAMEPLLKLGAEAARSPAEVADRVETVMTSLPSLDIGMKVVNGEDGLIRGNRVRRYVDLSTTGSRAAVKTAEILKQRNIVQIDCPVSGGVAGAEKGTLAVMVSGPSEEIDNRDISWHHGSNAKSRVLELDCREMTCRSAHRQSLRCELLPCM